MLDEKLTITLETNISFLATDTLLNNGSKKGSSIVLLQIDIKN